RDLTPAIAIKGIKPLGSTEAPGGICVMQDGSVTVRIDSFAVGHMFPSGASQDRRMWLSIKVLDANGTILFERGNVPTDKDPEETTDPSLSTDCTFPTSNPTGCGAFFDRAYKS